MKDQSFTSIEQQIQLLKRRGLRFASEETAAYHLAKYGYYNIINGYKDNFVIKDGDEEYYRDNVSFERIFSLFILDHSIRNTVMLAMLDIEEMLKTSAAYIIAEAFTSEYSKYSDIRNYKNIPRKNERFSLKHILKKFDEAYCSDKDPIRYHREHYNNVPPWVLFKGVYLSTMVNYIRYFKAPQKEKIIYSILDISDISTVDIPMKKCFSDLLYLFLEYRNLCAHAGRVYNHCPDANVRIDPDLLRRLGIPENRLYLNSLGRLIAGIMMLRDDAPIYNIKRTLSNELDRHCVAFPDDKEYLLKIMDIEHIKLS